MKNAVRLLLAMVLAVYAGTILTAGPGARVESEPGNKREGEILTGHPVIAVCPECPFTDIHRALEYAEEGATIEITGGVYHVGTLEINKPVEIIGINNPQVIGDRKGHVINVKADNVHIRSLVLSGSGRSDIEEYAAIHGDSIQRCDFQDNVMVDNTYGIYLAHVKDCTIAGNVTTTAAKSEVMDGNGIHLWYSKELKIHNNLFYGHRDGIYMEFSEDLHITENRAYENIRYGLHFMFSHDNVFKRNVFSRNGTGTAIMYSKRIQVQQNIFENSRGSASYGVLLKDITDSEIKENRFYDNSIAIYCDNSMRNTINGNSIQGNGRALYLPGNCGDNEFKRNDFIENYFDVTTNSRDTHGNTILHNYWSNAEKFDYNNDGYSDKRYRPVSVYGYWVGKYPLLGILMESPVIEFVEMAEKVLPVITPEGMEDPEPAMTPQAQKERLP